MVSLRSCSAWAATPAVVALLILGSSAAPALADDKAAAQAVHVGEAPHSLAGNGVVPVSMDTQEQAIIDPADAGEDFAEAFEGAGAHDREGAVELVPVDEEDRGIAANPDETWHEIVEQFEGIDGEDAVESLSIDEDETVTDLGQVDDADALEISEAIEEWQATRIGATDEEES